jgi:phenylalanyl-tRNA synthetase beta chain
VKSDVETLTGSKTARFEAASHSALHPGRSARDPAARRGWLEAPSAPTAVRFTLRHGFELNLDALTTDSRPREFSRQPMIGGHFGQVDEKTMLDSLKKRAPRIVCEVALFDLYRGKGIDSDKKSVAFRLLLQDTHKTLTDAEVEAAKQQLVHVLQEEFQAKLRK